jgi:RNA polymerase-interacting CarD/CdnL/TRCF family regulator
VGHWREAGVNAKLNVDSPFPEPAAHAPDAPRLTVGDLVVYASHGIGRVESRDDHGDKGEMLVLVFENGLKVTLPLDRARSTLRAPAGEEALEAVQRTLGSDSPPSSEHWSRRHRNSQAKLVGGTVGGLAEIVRDGVQRERERGKGGTVPITNQLYRTARKLLIAEVALARGIEPDAAEAWIVQQVTTDAPTTAGARQGPSTERANG